MPSRCRISTASPPDPPWHWQPGPLLPQLLHYRRHVVDVRDLKLLRRARSSHPLARALLRTNQARRELLVRRLRLRRTTGPQGQGGRARRLSSICTLPLPRPSVRPSVWPRTDKSWMHILLHPTNSIGASWHDAHQHQPSYADAAFENFCIDSDGKMLHSTISTYYCNLK